MKFQKEYRIKEYYFGNDWRFAPQYRYRFFGEFSWLKSFWCNCLSDVMYSTSFYDDKTLAIGYVKQQIKYQQERKVNKTRYISQEEILKEN